jgi:hypothetical protein
VGSFSGGAKLFAASPRTHRLDESATGYSSASCTPALLASASPVNGHGESIAGNRQPPLAGGWGIFDWRNGEFSGSSALLVQDSAENMGQEKCFSLWRQWRLPRAIRKLSCPNRNLLPCTELNDGRTSSGSSFGLDNPHSARSAVNNRRRGIADTRADLPMSRGKAVPSNSGSAFTDIDVRIRNVRERCSVSECQA